jgi:hypothetical protein
LGATAGASADAVGTYAVRSAISGTSPWASGSTVAGSTIGGLSGTWRAMGAPRQSSPTFTICSCSGTTGAYWLGLYLRIS